VRGTDRTVSIPAAAVHGEASEDAEATVERLHWLR
jgi:hypothetical protein